VDVVEVVDRWFEPEYRYFRVKGGNGKIYLLRHRTTRDSWELTASKGSESIPEKVQRSDAPLKRTIVYNHSLIPAFQDLHPHTE
jgi:hypothetical protein